MSLTVIPAQRFMRLQASSGSHQAVVGTREAEPNADVSASRHLEASPSVAGGEEDGTNEEEERQVTGMLSDVLEEDEESVATAETDNSDTATIVPSASSSSSGKKKKKRGANKKKRKDRQTEGPDPVMAEEISGDSRKKTDTDQKVSLVTEAIQMASESTGPVLKGLGIMVGSSQPINSTPSHEWQRHQERDTEEVIESKFKSFRISNVRADVKQWRAQRLGGVEMVRTAEALMIDTSEEPDMDFTPKIGNWRNQPQSQPNANASFDDLFTPTPTNNDQSPSVPITPTDQHTQSDDDATPPATPKARRYGEFVFSPDTSPRIVPLFPPEVSRASSPIVELENSIIEDVPQDEYDEKMQTPELSHQSVFDSAPNSPMAILTTPTGTPQLSTASIILGNEPRLQLTPRILITNSSPPHAELPPSPPSLPAPPAHQPLKTRHSWTLLFSNTSEKAKSVAARQVSVISGLPTATAEAYSHGLVTLFTASNLHDLFGCYKALRRKIATAKHRPIEPVGSPLMPNVFGLGIAYMPDDNNFHFFREGVKPMWEDPMCASGGKLMLAGHPDKVSNPDSSFMIPVDQLRIPAVLSTSGRTIADTYRWTTSFSKSCLISSATSSKTPARHLPVRHRRSSGRC